MSRVDAGTSQHGWMITASGRRFYPVAPHAADVCIEDVAHTLSNICRFGGHTSRFYSVAQHSVMVSKHVPGPLAIYGLLHDAPEAYVGDMIRPLKEQVPQFAKIEEAVWRAVLQRFDLAHPTPALWQYVKDADNKALVTERRDLLPRQNSTNWREDEQGVEPYPDKIRALPPYEARVEFMVRWRELTRGRAT